MVWASVVLTAFGLDVALGGAYTIDASKFEVSNRSFPECNLPDQKLSSPRIINFPLESIEINIVEGRNSTYCVSVRDIATDRVQSIIISKYKFVAIHVGDLITSGRVPFAILFSAGFFNQIAVTVFDGKLIITHR